MLLLMSGVLAEIHYHPVITLYGILYHIAGLQVSATPKQSLPASSAGWLHILSIIQVHNCIKIMCHTSVLQVIGHTKTILVLLISWLALGESMSARKLAGMAVAVAGQCHKASADNLENPYLEICPCCSSG